MEQTRLYELIRKLADDKATPEEAQELHEWYRSVYAVGEVEWPSEDPAAEEEQLRQRIWDQLHPRPRFRVFRMVARAAACLVLLGVIRALTHRAS